MISPSLGITSPATISTMSPDFSAVETVSSIVPSALRRRAGVARRVFRRASAWALPRASAIDEAKLANKSVATSQKSSDSR